MLARRIPGFVKDGEVLHMRGFEFTRLSAAVGMSILMVACSGKAPTSPSTSERSAGMSEPSAATTAAVTSASGNNSAAPQPSAPRAGLEINYLEFVADHHLMGVMMAQMCIEKAVHEELRADCQRDLENQQREIEVVKRLLLQYYGIPYEPSVDGEGRMTQLQRLTGSEFERRFLEEFPRHHKTIIQRSETLVKNAVHQEVRQMAENIVSAQTADAIRLVTWKCQWYGDCNPVAGFFPAA